MRVVVGVVVGVVLWVVVVTGGSVGRVVVGTRPVAGVVSVVEGTTWPLPDPPPPHAPSSATAPMTRPHHHTRMAGP
ncbi:hypothetical protein DMH01_30780 [Amycolatopsis sp. WAC 04182]|uniref:hypothetical protein n=1 Tax=Amycolatopsis sp. WAC 04182 TaxID=2203198 RepID=UPI000F770F3E|nr:hypothetical protein [Amycolatopsis sp. WAC 04182]RSN56188.1 hypothetical protein DMH01_30780 [Amycolatopsis sp. WAC 04182]